jgi:mannose-6-phosphate isomerase-like protein (cupin superfamily)
MRMEAKEKYKINLDIKYGYLKRIDIPALVKQTREQWFNQTLCRINDCVARLGVIKGEFHWHKHDSEDEFFLVLEGKLVIELKEQTIELLPHQGFTVPKGVLHRTRAPKRTVILMREGSTVTPQGD